MEAGKRGPGLTVSGRDFLLDGKKISIYSGAVHYFRSFPESWRGILEKLRAAGFNTVETYVCWNLHEPEKGRFDFSGMLDIERFLALSQELGLYAIVRPGPYICAEWDFGGLPAWLLREQGLRLRCSDPQFLRHVREFYQELAVKLRPHLLSNGGNIIAMQVENEYGSYGNDRQYMQAIRELMIECGMDALLFTADGAEQKMLTGGLLPGTLATLNFGSAPTERFALLEECRPGEPRMCMEFWNGWFDQWGGPHHTRSSKEVAEALEEMLALDASFNFYMFYGGTNFGFTAGANHYEEYQPTVTSYDDDALLNEWGGYTEKYHTVRKILRAHQGLQEEALPPEPELQSIGRVELNGAASLREHVDAIGQMHRDLTPRSMECYGQNYGMILYRTRLTGAYGKDRLYLRGLADKAYVFLDGKPIGSVYRNDAEQSLALPEIGTGGAVLDILVEAMGRVNYGRYMPDRKGLSQVSVEHQVLFDWEIYTIPMDDLRRVTYDGRADEMPVLLHGEFSAQAGKSCFVHLPGFRKGMVFVNGFCLGRYWEIGPQRSLHLPGALLRDQNEIVVLELEGYQSRSVEILNRHIIG